MKETRKRKSKDGHVEEGLRKAVNDSSLHREEKEDRRRNERIRKGVESLMSESRKREKKKLNG